jgi:nucleoside-diphosphate-sugar epimerase
MKTERAKRQLRWRPKHTSRQTLKETVAARREEAPAAR